MTENKFFMDTRPLTPEYLEVAKNELRETPEVVQKAIEELRKMLKEGNKYKFRDDDAFLTAMLRPVKFYPESAYKQFEKISAFRQKYSNVLANLDPNNETERIAIMQHDVVNVLVDRDQHGRRILILKVGGTWDPKSVSTDTIFRMLYMVHILGLCEPLTQVAGVVSIMDFDGMGMKQATSFSISFATMLLTFIQEAMPLRLKGLHIVNQPFIFNMVWKIFKPLIQEKLSKRLFLHGKKMTDLHKHIDVNHLPADYGGNLPKMNYTSKDWMPVIQEVAPETKAWNDYGYKK